MIDKIKLINISIISHGYLFSLLFLVRTLRTYSLKLLSLSFIIPHLDQIHLLKYLCMSFYLENLRKDAKFHIQIMSCTRYNTNMTEKKTYFKGKKQ